MIEEVARPERFRLSTWSALSSEVQARRVCLDASQAVARNWLVLRQGAYYYFVACICVSPAALSNN